MSSPQHRAAAPERRRPHVLALAVVGALLLASVPGAEADIPEMPASPGPIWSKTFDDQTQGRTGRVEVVGDRVFADVGPSIDDNIMRTYAFDPRTGRNLYTLTRGVSDLIVHDEAGSYLASADEARRTTLLTGYDLEGRESWHATLAFVVTSMSVTDNRLFLVERDNSRNSAKYYAFDTHGTLIWKTGAWSAARGFADARVMGSGLFVAHSCGAIDRFSAATGQKRWSRTPTCAGTPVPWLPTSSGKRLYTQVKEGSYRVLDFTNGATREDKQWDALPQVDGSTGYFIRDGVLSAVDMKTGHGLWKLRAASGVHRVVAMGENRVAVVAGGDSNRIILLDATSGKIRWSASFNEPSGVFVGSGRVIVGWGPSLVAYPL